MALSHSSNPRFERSASRAVAFLSSLVVHVALLLILACWLYTAGKPSRGIMLSADVGESSVAAFDLVQRFDLEPQQEEQIQESSEAEFTLDVDLDGMFESVNDDAVGGLRAALASLSTTDVADRLETRGRGRGASFFGSYANGDRFVYVLDSSMSMKGERWTYACNELIDSLNGLRPGQEFFVICFDMETSFLFNVLPQRAQFVPIDDEIVVRVRRWLRSRTLGRATKPAEALRIALEFKPDAVFLLSDGELQDNSLLMLRMLNGLVSNSPQIPIHTVHLFSAEGRQTLQQIAVENSGTFTPIHGR